MGGTAHRAATATLIAAAIVVAALALWKLRIVIALLFLGFVIASAMGPSIEWLDRRDRVPRSVGVVVHYFGFLGAFLIGIVFMIPIAAIAATLIDVVIRDHDPAKEDAPTVLFAGDGRGEALAHFRHRRPGHVPVPGTVPRTGETEGTGGGEACLARARLAPAAEHQTAEREAEPERADPESADRRRLPRRRKALPTAERLPLLVRQFLAAPLLAQRAAGAQPDVEVVEDLGGVFAHCFQSIASFGRECQAPPCIRPARGYT
jgi:hypothetical protein